MTEPLAPPANPYLQRNFAPVSGETTSFDLKVTGQILEALNERFLQMGPNPAAAPESSSYHWFGGTGMAHGLRLRDGKADWYRSRYVTSAQAAAALGRDALPGPGLGKRDGPVNTNFTVAGSKLFALVESGSLPIELDYELNSIARSDFDGSLEAAFAAYPKFDPVTREQHVLTYEPGQPVRYMTLGPDGRAVTHRQIDLPHCPLIHDVAFSASSIVVLDLPVTFQPGVARATFPWIWGDRAASRVGLIDRANPGGDIQWFEAPRSFVFHFVNAYDDGARTVVDLVRHPRMFEVDHNGPNEGVAVLARWTLDRATGRMTETILDDRGTEFPLINGAFGGKPYRYGYTAHWGQDVAFGPAFKHDVEAQTTEMRDYGRGRVTLEPVFVRREGAQAEDDGWILSYVYDAERDASDVVILDAQDFSGDPVAIIQLPVRVPFGFHGGWAPDSAFQPPLA